MATATKDNKQDEEVNMEPGAVYLGHIPHGFYEKEMTAYFSQFGEVTKVKLFRSKKTGRSQGFAFIEFSCSEVAKIVAETHDNYLLFEKLLKCHYVDPATLKPNTFKEFRLKKKHVQSTGKPKTQKAVISRVKRALNSDKKRRQRFKELGIDYEFPGYAHCIKNKEHTIKRPKHTKVFSDDEREKEEET